MNNPPAYATVSFTGDSTYTWATSTTDLRDLKPLAAHPHECFHFYSATNFTINANLTDGNTHRIGSLLARLGWNGQGGTISIVDVNTGAVLNSQSFSSFHNGKYAEWNITGNVQIRVTKTGGSNAVVSGIFFDPPATITPATANYLSADTTTEGTWTGKYGSQGQVIVNDLNSVPAYATLGLAGGAAYTWAASTSNTAALQTASGSSTRIASAYYSATSFTVNLNLTDGNTHKISLYLLDWLSDTRTETITITDFDSNAVLNTQSYSTFGNGEYASWNISGHVLITVTRAGGPNAVLSGIFFDPQGTVTPATAA